MLGPSEQELRKHKAYYKTDTDFTAFARLLQSKWREGKDYPMGKSMFIDKNGIKRYGDYYGNYIDEIFANEKGCNFLTSKIWNIAQKEMEKAKNDNNRKKHSGAFYEEYRFICNLLTSQSLCFNLFGEFLDRKDILYKILNEIKPNLMDGITEINFEYSPGRGDEKYLGDHTAADVFIEYEKNNEKNFLSIEAKYVETLTEESQEKAEINFRRHPQYREITENCGLFKKGIIDDIRKPPFSQIWRDHLLSISIKTGEGKLYNNGYFVYLYPKNNSNCSSAVKEYMNFLLNPNDSIFEIYIEDLITIINKNIKEKWAEELVERYIKGL